METFFGKALVVGFLAFGRGPSGNHHAVDDVVVIHEVGERLDGIFGGLSFVVRVIPIHVRAVEVEVERGRPANELRLVIVRREQKSRAAVGVVCQSRGQVCACAGVADALAEVSVTEIVRFFLQISHSTRHNISSLILFIKLERAALRERATCFVRDNSAVAISLLPFYFNGSKRRVNLLSINR